MKILKFFISLSLILSVSLINSLAAISVSDGSAFVTKAEFAADLNNLSNRMSSLENSLDAKIDSLVSSYLSRNGIWNGEKQTHSLTLNKVISFSAGSNLSNTVIAKDVDGYTYTVGIGTGSVKVDGTQKDINRGANQSTAYQKFFVGIAHKFIKTSKAGLLNLAVSFTGGGSQYNEIFIEFNSWSAQSSAVGTSGVAGIVITKGDEYNPHNSNSQWVASSMYGYGTITQRNLPTSYSLQYVFLGFPFGKINMLGFVDKGDELSLSFTASGYSAIWAATSWKLGSEGSFKVDDINANIY